MIMPLSIVHHGAVDGVTGSCHQLTLPDGAAVLVDCGLFQGAETSPDGSAGFGRLQIGFDIRPVVALVVTHVHIDHVGRLPYLLAAGFKGPVVCSEASAELLPMVMRDALEVGFTRDRALIDRVVTQLKRQIIPLPYRHWLTLRKPGDGRHGRHGLNGRTEPNGRNGLRVKLQPAGHILGSAYVEFDVTNHSQAGSPAATSTAGATSTPVSSRSEATVSSATQAQALPGSAPPATRPQPTRVVFSGDLGAPYTPLLPAPKAPFRADVLVLESTYGDRAHESRRTRRERLRALCEHAFTNRGTLLIPAFSIGRTQELLYELEAIIHHHASRPAARGMPWGEVNILVDSPLAADFTAGYARLKHHWDAEARRTLARGRHPLAFEQLTTIASHDDHLRTVAHLARTAYPAIVIAASGMCGGGRIVNYLKAMLGDPRHDVLFCGYQAAGTPGRTIQTYGPRGGWVELDGQRITIRAGIHTLGGYSAHADQRDLLNFVGRMRHAPKQVRLVHGDEGAKQRLATLLRERHAGMDVVVARG
jgi:metallo-beta-lactamase family protein